jgi:nucleoside-diphosphate-sugar epimerase
MFLVTGGTGFIGTHLLERLAADGASVRALVRRKHAPRTLPPGVETVYGDLAAGEGLDEALADVQCVIHLAGVTKALHARDYYTGNVRATEKLARAIKGRGLRLVHVSSLAAIGPAREGLPVTEDAEPRPLTDYGRSKLEGERVVRELAPDAAIVRPPVVYGPRDTDVFQLLKSISRGLVLEIAGGERWFSAIYVKDLVEGLLCAARTPQAAGRPYFLANPKPVSWTQFASAAGTIMGCRPRVITVPAALAGAIGACAEIWAHISHRPGIISRDKITEARCMAWTCDTRRAAEELGFVAATSLEAGLGESLAWYKEAGWLSY